MFKHSKSHPSLYLKKKVKKKKQDKLNMGFFVDNLDNFNADTEN